MRSPADLRGRIVGVTGLGSSTSFLTHYLALTHGVKPTEVNLVPAGAGNRFIAAMREGTIEALPGMAEDGLQLRRLDPELRRFVSSYARRRPEISLDVRVQLASQVQSSLRAALPDVFAQSGPLAALDRLADLERQ